MTLSVDPITLDLKFQRLEFETGFDVRALIEERDRYKAALDAYSAPWVDNPDAALGAFTK